MGCAVLTDIVAKTMFKDKNFDTFMSFLFTKLENDVVLSQQLFDSFMSGELHTVGFLSVAVVRLIGLTYLFLQETNQM